MTTTQRMNPVRAPGQAPARASRTTSRWRRRLRNHLRTIFARGDISSLLTIWALMIVTASSLDAADWTRGLSALAVVSTFAVAFGFLLARSHYSELLALLLSSVYSLVVVVGVNAYTLVEQGSLRERIVTLAEQVGNWISAAATGGQPANDNVVFVIFLSVLFWFLGHNSAWHVFRVDRVWRVIILNGLVLVTNLFYYQGDASLDGYLIAFVLLSALLLIRSHIDAREFDWYLHRVSFPNYVRRTFFQAGGVIALVVVLAAWLAPAGQDDKSLQRLNNLLTGEPFTRLADLWNRLFSSLEASGIAASDYYGGEELQLSGAIQLGDQPVLVVQAPLGPRYYWRSTVYDSYDFSSWSWKHIRTVRAYTDESGLRLNIGPTLPGARREIDQKFTLLLRSSKFVYAAPQPVRLGLPVEAELDCTEDLGRSCVNENAPSDVSIIRARQTLRRSDSYTVTSSISAATADQLRQAGQDYPNWVLRLYLQGADSVAPPVRELAVQIVAQAGAQTPYDRAKAIERWLRTNIQYNESIPAPPPGRDAMEWFLFEERQGYCNYYATAMILMLRTQGIPARMAAGFAQGTWDPERNAYLVRERDAHTWVEVYFPGYGWVEFEPTADEAPLDRGDQTPQAVLPTVTPMPTATFTPTATPLPPTQETGANASPTSPAQAPFQPSTPTPTVIPTFTPPPPPDRTKVDTGGGSDILRAILLTLGIFVLVVLALALFAVFLIWYVEYRGLGGLNAMQRAYARLVIYGRWLGLRFETSATPDERRRHLIGEVPEGENPINTITRAYVQDRYGPPDRVEPDSTAAHSARAAWHEARWAFIRRKLERLTGRRNP